MAATLVEKAMSGGASFLASARIGALVLKGKGDLDMAALIGPTPGIGSFAFWGDSAKYQERYSLFRGYLYSAVNAIAMEAAGQQVKLIRLAGAKAGRGLRVKRFRSPIRLSKADQEWEVIEEHDLLDVLYKPNRIQGRWQFVYSFIANLLLTGWSYVVRGETEDGVPEFYSLPSTWIRPDHSDGPFSKFRLTNPRRPETTSGEPLERDRVGFAMLPNPSDPLSALAPASSQIAAIRIDEYIQESRERFFRNGIFPSVIVTVGKDPHPDVPGGMRPRLSPAQRGQVYSMIQRTMGGIYNQGNPAIVDGLIENIAPFSLTSKEMGWEKSEGLVKNVILSAFCVHPFILGEQATIGSQSQMYVIEKRFFARINTYLGMLSDLMSVLIQEVDGGEGLEVEYEPKVAIDESQRWQQLQFARTNEDISQNELRTELGMGPDEDRNESVLGKNAATVVQMLAQVGAGAITPEQARVMLIAMGLPDDIAKDIAGPPKPQAAPSGPGSPGEGVSGAGQAEPQGGEAGAPGEPVSGEEMAKAVEALQEAVDGLRMGPEQIADMIVKEAEA